MSFCKYGSHHIYEALCGVQRAALRAKLSEWDVEVKVLTEVYGFSNLNPEYLQIAVLGSINTVVLNMSDLCFDYATKCRIRYHYVLYEMFVKRTC